MAMVVAGGQHIPGSALAPYIMALHPFCLSFPEPLISPACLDPPLHCTPATTLATSAVLAPLFLSRSARPSFSHLCHHAVHQCILQVVRHGCDANIGLDLRQDTVQVLLVGGLSLGHVQVQEHLQGQVMQSESTTVRRDKHASVVDWCIEPYADVG